MKKILIISMLALLALVGITSCDSSKGMTKKDYSAQMETVKADLNAILDGTTNWSLEEQASRIAAIKLMNFKEKDKGGVNDLIARAEEKITQKIAEAKRKAEEERLKQEELLKQKEQQLNKETTLTIEDYFSSIAKSSDSETANNLISKALKLFATPDVPVLIRLNEYGDYDRPTTAEQYLNYLKDQKSVNVRINDIKYNVNKKITELELIKK